MYLLVSCLRRYLSHVCVLFLFFAFLFVGGEKLRCPMSCHVFCGDRTNESAHLGGLLGGTLLCQLLVHGKRCFRHFGSFCCARAHITYNFALNRSTSIHITLLTRCSPFSSIRRVFAIRSAQSCFWPSVIWWLAAPMWPVLVLAIRWHAVSRLRRPHGFAASKWCLP